MDQKPFLCLNMIVKNESKIIERLLNSVISIIDSYCICDTGSTDNTIVIIKKFFNERNIPGEVFELPFKDFGYNRTQALQRAKQWGKYVLLLDADMVLNIHPSFRKNDITLDVYQVKQQSSTLDYYNTRVVRTDIGVTCMGVTHEYYNIPNSHRSDRLDTLTINDIGDGGSKSDKFERDIRLLRRGLIDEPKNDRYHFYLANSYRDYGSMTGDIKYSRKAIKWYKKRIEMGGWNEELFISCLEMGYIFMKLKEPEHAIYWWLEAWTHRNSRAESLYEIIKYYREKGSRYMPLAGHFYNMAKDISYPHNDQLFIRKDVYNSLLDYEYSIIAYYMGWKMDHYRYLSLLGNHSNYTNIISNYIYYVKSLSSLEPLRHTFNGETTISLSPDKFRPSTPSIIPFKNGYLMNQRYVNYYIERNGSYTVNNPITTWNRRYILDRKLNIIQQFDFDNLILNTTQQYAGIEDVKIIQAPDGQVWFFGTEYDTKRSCLSITTGKYPLDSTTHKLDTQIIPTPQKAKCEKNWCYFVHKEKLNVVYKWSPLTIGHIDKGKLIIDTTNDNVPSFSKHLRGSTNGVAVNDEIWFLTHMVDYSSPRKYYHCIMILDANTLEYKNHSILFKFEEHPIEYCLGMVIEPYRMIFSYSCMDRETIVCMYDRPFIDEFLFK